MKKGIVLSDLTRVQGIVFSDITLGQGMVFSDFYSETASGFEGPSGTPPPKLGW